MKQIPKYSKELIEQLDLEVLHPELPKSLKGWAGLNEAELRRGAYLAGRRSVVDDLLSALEEDNESDDRTSSQESSVMGYSARSYSGVASPYMAPGYPEDQNYPVRRPDEFDFGD